MIMGNNEEEHFLIFLKRFRNTQVPCLARKGGWNDGMRESQGDGQRMRKIDRWRVRACLDET